jgi:hypothetical protein
MPNPSTPAMLATIENMQAWAGPDNRDVFAYSPTTGEQFSADAADYWNAPAGWAMTDSEGEPMILARRVETIAPLLDA